MYTSYICPEELKIYFERFYSHATLWMTENTNAVAKMRDTLR